MIDLTINKTGLEHNLRKAKENRIIIPTIAQMQHPETIPEKIRERLKTVGLWDVDPLNLFRITWKNEAKESGGMFQAVPNYIELPPALTGVPCRIVAMVGKWFPTGCHKVGASFGCLAPGDRPVRREQAQGRVALHRQLLPRRRLQLPAAGRPGRGHPAGGDEPGAV